MPPPVYLHEDLTFLPSRASNRQIHSEYFFFTFIRKVTRLIKFETRKCFEVKDLTFSSLCRGICENVFHFFTLTCRKPPNSFRILQPLSNKTNRMGFTNLFSRKVAHVFYQLFDSKMADGDQLWSVPKLKNYLLRRNASTNVRKTYLIERYILHRKPKNTIYVRYFSMLYLLNVQVASTENITL